jgi:hypothetical protein
VAFEGYCAGGFFPFPGLGLMLRRSSLALTGLFDTRFVLVDQEFSYRLTSGPANLAWFTGTLWVWLLSPRSNSVAQQERALRDLVRLRRYYGVIHRGASARATLLDAVRTVLRPLKRRLQRRAPAVAPPASLQERLSPAECFARSDPWLEKINRERPGEVLVRARIGEGRFACRAVG